MFVNAANVQQPVQQQPQTQQITQEHQNIHQQMTQHQQQPQSTMQTMRLRDNPPPITPTATRPSRKRKSPPSNTQDGAQQQQQQPPTPQNTVQHVLPHTLVHPPPHLQGPPPQLPPGYAYAPTDYTPGGIPPPPHPGQLHQPPEPSPEQRSPGSQGRALSSSKRAEQNRKAQRAFRERRDQHVKALESRSQLLDTALASADEANRRWEECRTLVDQLRIENAALRAALSQAQMLPHGGGGVIGANNNGHVEEGAKQDEGEVTENKE